MSGIKDAKKKRARRRRKRQIQRILLIIAMILILIGFLFLIRAAVHAVVNKFTGPTVTTSADKTAAFPPKKAKKNDCQKKQAKKKKSSKKEHSKKSSLLGKKVFCKKTPVELKNGNTQSKRERTIRTRFLLPSAQPETVRLEPMKVSTILPA